MFGKTKWKYLVLPMPRKTVNQQYLLTGGFAEISRCPVLKVAGVVVSTPSPFNSSIWPVKKTDGSWRIRVDYRKLN